MDFDCSSIPLRVHDDEIDVGSNDDSQELRFVRLMPSTRKAERKDRIPCIACFHCLINSTPNTTLDEQACARSISSCFQPSRAFW